MESGDSEEYQNKFKIRRKLKLRISGDSESDVATLESVEDAILTGKNSAADDTGKGSSEGNVILRHNVEDVIFVNKNRRRISKDGRVYNLPKYTYMEPPMSPLINTRPLLREAATYERDEEQIVEITELPESSLVNTRALLREATAYERNEEQIVEITELPESSFINTRALLKEATTYERNEEQIVEITELPESSLVNTRALLKEATTYELESFDKHALIIFNHTFDGLEHRFGTQHDVDALTTTFENFGFEVTQHHDLTKDEIFGELEEFSKRDFTDYGCVAVAILTHGSDNGMLQAADQDYSEMAVINKFKVDDAKKARLVSKPKIFIIQACRGDEVSPGVRVLQSGRVSKDYSKYPKPYYILPLESDLLILHSSYPGCASHRNDLYGSWFIQTLCKKINALSLTQDLESIITEVKRDVAIDMEYEEYNTSTRVMQVNKQMPVMTSTLIRKLYLKFGDGALEETWVDKLKQRNESRRVLDAVRRPVQAGSCCCFLDHFTYMRNCLRYFIAEIPNDETAQEILDAANTYKDSVQFNESKNKMCKIMSNLLMDKARDSPFYKYLHFVPGEQKVTKSKNAQKELSVSPKSSFSSLDICLTGFFVATFVFVLRNVKSN